MNNNRYARQMILPDIGEEGQQKLTQAKVLIVGIGGLGCPAALYLAGAGIGHLGLIDPDRVSLSNLQRQVLYSSQDVGRPKVEAARERLLALNPEIEIQSWAYGLNPDNAIDLVSPYDMVLDGSDNLSTRYLLNDVCRLLHKPLVHGSVYRFEGQVASFVPGGPCYRCLYPVMPPAGAMPNCAEAGVLGVLPGVVGTLQATEVLRLILGWGEGLNGQLLLADLKNMAFQTLELPVDPACPACSGQIIKIDPMAYPELLCARDEMTVAEARTKLLKGKLLALDVRSAAEHAAGALGELWIPLPELEAKLHTLNPELDLLVYCQQGQRSARAVSLLRSHGFGRLWSLTGGYAAWTAAPEP
ncbi:MAG: molybdenum cofactor biosynthesis protein MoeB [Candidatus Melainabacteria bacterium HGW-Melainabacteria-1]|nr:MAG: molybdenum cofactor biosynthesis protein MoeB [Candidatus Melainabacteria bacterium HGW-Melainabacteria-1]